MDVHLFLQLHRLYIVVLWLTISQSIPIHYDKKHLHKWGGGYTTSLTTVLSEVDLFGDFKHHIFQGSLSVVVFKQVLPLSFQNGLWFRLVDVYAWQNKGRDDHHIRKAFAHSLFPPPQYGIDVSEIKKTTSTFSSILFNGGFESHTNTTVKDVVNTDDASQYQISIFG